jgi:hypothetical protein
MINIQPIADDAHEITIYGAFTSDDMAQFVAFVREQNAAGRGGNVLFDLVSLADFTFAAVLGELSHIPALMQWVYRLDRIAVISDEEWIRSAARLESALLPGVTYAVYDEDQVAAARAWVLGQNERPYAGAMRERSTDDNIAVFEIVGRLDREESELMVEQVRARLADPACSRLMVVIRKWHGFDVDTMISSKLMQGKLDLIDQVERYALVGGPAWLRHMAGGVGALIKPQVRAFGLEEEDAALQWLRTPS